MAKSRRISFIMMGILPFILVTSNLVWCGTTQQHEESSEEKNLGAEKSSPCTHPLAPVAGTVNNIVESLGNISNNYVSLVRFIINFDKERHNETIWHWGLGWRGRFMLSLTYDNYSLSLGTLKFGIHPISITLNSSIVDNGSFSDICLVNTLFNISRQVRSRVQTPYSNDIEYDVICKEIDESQPFNKKLFPGYSLFQLQASTYYKCWNITEININRADPEAEIHCIIVKLAFCVAYPCIFLAVAYKLWCIYAGASNPQGEEESVNILRINWIPSSISSYSPLVYATLFLVSYLFIFTLHVCISDEYKNRSHQRGQEFWMDTWVLDFILSNILYLLGLLVLYLIISWPNNDGRVLEKPYNWASKNRRIVCYAEVFILCFLRLSATVMLFVEIIFCTVIGIIININYVSSIWINVIIAVLLLIAIIRQFFDKYQTLYFNIYSIGRKADEENTFPNKIFEQSRIHANGASQRQFMIKSSLLKDIVKRKLPLSDHIFKAIKHIILGLVFIGGVALIVYLIDRHFRLSLLIEYVLTIVSLVLLAASRVKGLPLGASGEEKNIAQDELIQLEADLIHYAETGEFPQPEASHWRSFSRHVSSHVSNAPEQNKDEEYELLDGSNDSHSLHSV